MIRESLEVRIMRRIKQGPLSRRRLAQAFTHYQAQVSTVLESLLAKGYITISGDGKRGKPVIVKATELMQVPDFPTEYIDQIIRQTEEEKIQRASGALAYHQGKEKEWPTPDWPRKDKYTERWYRLKHAWEAGWKEGLNDFWHGRLDQDEDRDEIPED